MTPARGAVKAALASSRRWLVFGANTDVGKTVVSAGVVRASFALAPQATRYVKVLQTGTAEGHSDEAFVRRALGAQAGPQLNARTLFSWGPAVSPHLAAEEARLRTGKVPPADAEVVERALAAAGDGTDFCLLETAGGVLSPGAVGSLQADMYQPLAKLLPVLLVGDGKLGGISTTLTALEALEARGYQVPAVAVITDPDEMYGNSEYLASRFLTRKVSTRVFPFAPLPRDPKAPLDRWYADNDSVFKEMLSAVIALAKARAAGGAPTPAAASATAPKGG
jgi:dethiobiotin synthetase/adenosylmethionine--8-amino-7-oxononanoate aminotransferase